MQKNNWYYFKQGLVPAIKDTIVAILITSLSLILLFILLWGLLVFPSWLETLLLDSEFPSNGADVLMKAIVFYTLCFILFFLGKIFWEYAIYKGGEKG